MTVTKSTYSENEFKRCGVHVEDEGAGGQGHQSCYELHRDRGKGNNSSFSFCVGLLLIGTFQVREATNDDPWGPSGQQMQDIAACTFTYEAFPEVMGMLW